MSRVTENSNTNSLNFALGKTKSKLEDLQLKGTTLKRMTKPSDDPVGNVQLLSIRSQNVDTEQYIKNSNFASTHLQITENALEDLSEIFMKAKEIAIAQSSDIYNPEVRKNVAMEVSQLRKQALSISNRKLGSKYLFGGYSTLTKPFDDKGKYAGDKGVIQLEVGKDFFIPINLNGDEVFIGKASKMIPSDPLEGSPLQLRQDPKLERLKNTNPEIKRDLATDPLAEQALNENRIKEEEGTGNVFKALEKLEVALQTANADVVQNLLPELDDVMSRIITLRSRIGSITSTLENSEASLERNKVNNEKHKSMIEDADVGELYSEIQKQQGILAATYKSGSNLLNQSLLDFLR